MAKKRNRSSGLVQINGIWHVDKRVRGRRLCESTGTSNLKEAETYLVRRLEEIRQAAVYGVRPSRTFREAATKYLNEAQKRSLDRDARALKAIEPFIGQLPLCQVHVGTLRGFIEARLSSGIKQGTINRDLAVVRRILNLAARSWRDEHGMTWLESAPLIELPQDEKQRRPYPLSWDEQRLLFQELPPHLERMALFKVNTGLREGEVCGLRWDWEVSFDDTSMFVIPSQFVKNKDDRLVVLNDVARSVVEEMRGQHPTHVFHYRGRPVTRMMNSGWKSARRRAAAACRQNTGEAAPFGFARIRVHDLKHTFGRRLRAAGVSFEDRQDLLGHRSGRVTTHYSTAEIGSLVEAANKVCRPNSRKTPELVLVRVSQGGVSA